MISKTFLTLSCQGAHMLDQCGKEFFAMSDERKVTCMLDEDQFLFGALTMLKYCTATDVGVAISSFPCITKKGSRRCTIPIRGIRLALIHGFYLYGVECSD